VLAPSQALDDQIKGAYSEHFAPRWTPLVAEKVLTRNVASFATTRAPRSCSPRVSIFRRSGICSGTARDLRRRAQGGAARCGRPSRTPVRTVRRVRHMTTKCGQDRFLRGSVLALWLLPELDLNQQPCDLRSNLLAPSGRCVPLPVSCSISVCEHPPVPAGCHRFVGQPGGKMGCRS
jgi:hypothetical protein